MSDLWKAEAAYLQAPEGEEVTWLTNDRLDAFNQTIRAKMLKMYGEALTESGIAATVGDEDTKAAMQDMNAALDDALGTSPLQLVAKE